MRRTLLVVGGGLEAVPGIERARALGLDVAVADLNPDAPGARLADHVLVASTYDPEGVVRAAAAHRAAGGRVDGVLSLGADVPVTVATVAHALGLPGLPLDAAHLAADKLAMKERLRAAGVAVPWFRPVAGAAELGALLRDHPRPLVLKPVDSRGARGVLRRARDTDPAWAWAESVRHSPTGRVMVEEYETGPQFSTEALALGDRTVTLGFAERNYELLDRYAPFIIENGGQQPSVLAPRDRDAVAELAARAGAALGIARGVIKGDMVLTPEGPKVIEIAARLSGGWLSSDQIPLHTGVDFVGAAIRLALGETVRAEELVPVRAEGVAIRYAFPPPGRVTAVEGVERAAALPGVRRVVCFVRPGDELPPPSNHTLRAACAIAVGRDRAEAVARAEAAVAALGIRTAA